MDGFYFVVTFIGVFLVGFRDQLLMWFGVNFNILRYHHCDGEMIKIKQINDQRFDLKKIRPFQDFILQNNSDQKKNLFKSQNQS